MSLQGIRGGFFCPMYLLTVNGVPTNGSYTIDASGEELALVCLAPATGTIRKIHANVATNTVSGDCEGRLEGVDGSGLPDNTLLHASATKLITISATGWTTWDFGVGNGASVTLGDLIAVVLKDDSTSVWQGAIRVTLDDMGTGAAGFPYLVHLGSKVDFSPAMALEYSDGSYHPIPNVWPFTSQGFLSWDNADNPQIRGMKFQIPFPARCLGFWFWGGGNTGSTFEGELYDSDGAPFATPARVVLDGDYSRSASNARIHTCYFSDPPDLAKDTNYWIALNAENTTDLFLCYFDVNSNDVLDAVPGGKNWFYSTTNTDPPTATGDWSDTNTRRPWMGLILDQFDDAVGGGGGGGNVSQALHNIESGIAT